MARMHLCSPWVTRVSELEAMFKYDDEIKIIYDDEDKQEVRMLVDNPAKAAALTELLPQEYVFGSVTLHVTIVPSNRDRFGFGIPHFESPANLFEAAFDGNKALSFTKTLVGVFEHPLTYVVFKNEVVQYWNDDLGDIFGQCSTLFQELAKNIFGDVIGVCYCTDKPNSIYTMTVPWDSVNKNNTSISGF